MAEIWKPVPYKPYETKYSVSNLGRVKPSVISRYSKNKTEFLTPVPSPRGYLFVSLYAEGKQYSGFIHRMVALAFHGDPPEGKPYALHRNGNQIDNHAENLYWGNEADNHRDRQLHGATLIGTKNGNSKLSEDKVKQIRQLHENGYTHKQLAAKFNVSVALIYPILRREIWKHI
jgi:hypothetical protein